MIFGMDSSTQNLKAADILTDKAISDIIFPSSIPRAYQLIIFVWSGGNSNQNQLVPEKFANRMVESGG